MVRSIPMTEVRIVGICWGEKTIVCESCAGCLFIDNGDVDPGILVVVRVTGILEGVVAV